MASVKLPVSNQVNEYLSYPRIKTNPDVGLEFVVFDGNPVNLQKSRKSIRSQAARSSAAARKATIIKKDAGRLSLYRSQLAAESVAARKEAALCKADTLPSQLLPGLAKSHNLSIIHNRLHHELFTGSPLYYPGMLAAFTQTNFGSPFLLWIKDIAIRGIRHALTFETFDDRIDVLLDISIATLAGWDLAHGDSESLQAHLKALKTLASRRGKETKRRQELQGPITSVNVEFIRTVGRDLAVLAWKDSDLPASRTLLELGEKCIPVGLAPFEKLLSPVIFNIFLGLAYFHSQETNGSWKLRKYMMQLSALSPPSADSKDDKAAAVNFSLHHHTRIGLLQQACCLYEAEGYITPYDDLVVPAEGRELVNEDSRMLDSDILVDTVYEPLLLWSLMIMCAAAVARFGDRMKLLTSLIKKRGIESFDQLIEYMSTIAYHPQQFDWRCHSVWEELQSHSESKD